MQSLEDPRAGVRSAAINSLGSIAITKGRSGVIHPEPLIAAFRGMMKDQDAMVRGEAIGAIGRAAPDRQSDPPAELIKALNDESSPNRLSAIEVLTRFHAGMERVLPHLIRGFEQSSAGSPERAAYVRAIRVTRPPAVTSACLPALLAALKSPDAQLRFESRFVDQLVRSGLSHCRTGLDRGSRETADRTAHSRIGEGQPCELGRRVCGCPDIGPGPGRTE